MYPYRHISSQDSSFRIRSTQGADFRLCADFSGLTQFCCQFFDSCFNTSFDAGSSRCSEYYDDHDYDCRNDDHTVLFQKCLHWTFTSIIFCFNPRSIISRSPTCREHRRCLTSCQYGIPILLRPLLPFHFFLIIPLLPSFTLRGRRFLIYLFVK